MIWLGLFLVCAILNWLSVERGWRQWELFSKPLALILLIFFFWQNVGWEGGRLWIGLGLVFSLAGDIFLLWTKRFFMPGLAAFLLAHVCYIIGLNQDSIQLQIWTLVVIVMVIGVGVIGYRFIRRRISDHPENEKFQLPILAYCLIISLMLLSAWMCLFRPLWSVPAGWVVTIGASLFSVSDFLLATGLFVKRIPHGHVLVMVTYHLAQLAIVVGVMLRYLG